MGTESHIVVTLSRYRSVLIEGPAVVVIGPGDTIRLATPRESVKIRVDAETPIRPETPRDDW